MDIINRTQIAGKFDGLDILLHFAANHIPDDTNPAAYRANFEVVHQVQAHAFTYSLLPPHL